MFGVSLGYFVYKGVQKKVGPNMMALQGNGQEAQGRHPAVTRVTKWGGG